MQCEQPLLTRELARCCDADQVPEQLNWDYGEPAGLCTETAPNSGVFTREWTKASVKMDCNTWTPTISLK